MFQFKLLDPRNVPAATQANEAVFANPVYGIEVTVPALAARCVTNLDPQHTGGDTNLAAIEAALTCEVPPDGATLATVRADLDALGAMVVLELRRDGVDIATPEITFRIHQVAEADRFARGPYPGPTALPTAENPWSEGGATQQLAAIGAAVMDFKVTLDARASMMKHWLLTGEEPAAYRASVEKERLELVAALAGGQIKAEVKGGIALVETTHRAATMVGYTLAPVVIAVNPAFRLQGSDPHRKYTVCQYQMGHVNLKAVTADLQALEAGWGGSPTIVGSPQGVSSQLTIQQVTEIVARHLKK